MLKLSDKLTTWADVIKLTLMVVDEIISTRRLVHITQHIQSLATKMSN